MKRDPDLIKKILLEYEKLPAPPNSGENIEIDGYDHEVVVYHQLLLLDDGYIVGSHEMYLSGSSDFTAERLTNKGHDFLEMAKNDTAWNRTKEIITKQGGGFAMDIISKVMTDVILRMMGLP